MELSTLIIINDLLLDYGLTQEEIDILMARFLREEAFDFVEAMKQEGYSAEDMEEEGNVA